MLRRYSLSVSSGLLLGASLGLIFATATVGPVRAAVITQANAKGEETANAVNDQLQSPTFADSLLDIAYLATGEVSEPEYKFRLLEQLAIAQADSSPTKAAQYLSEALLILNAIEDLETRGLLLARLADAYDSALNDGAKRDELLESAMALIDSVDLDNWQRSSVFQAVLTSYAKAGEHAQAYEMARWQADIGSLIGLRYILTHEMLPAVIASGQGDRVRDFIMEIDFGNNELGAAGTEHYSALRDRMQALQRLIKAYGEANQPEKVEELIGLHESIVLQLPPGLVQAQAYTHLGSVLITSVDARQALPVLNQARELLVEGLATTDASSSFHDSARTELFLGKLYVQAGSEAEGIALIQSVVDRELEAETSEALYEKAEHLLGVAETLYDISHYEQSIRLIEQTEQVLAQLDVDDREIGPILLEIAIAYTSTGQHDQARQLVSRLQPIFEYTNNSPPRLRIQDYQWVLLLMELGYTQQALEMVDSVQDTQLIERIMREYDLAQNTPPMETLMPLISDIPTRVNALLTLAERYGEQGEQQRNFQLIEQALQLAQKHTLLQENMSPRGAIYRALHSYEQYAPSENVRLLLTQITSPTVRADIYLRMLADDYTANKTVAVQSVQATIEQIADPIFRSELQGELNSIVETEGCFTQSFDSVLYTEHAGIRAGVLIQMASCYKAMPSQPLSPRHADFLQQLG